MGQMAPQVIGLALVLLPAFCATVGAEGEGSERPKSDFAGHSSPSFTGSINKWVVWRFKLPGNCD